MENLKQIQDPRTDNQNDSYGKKSGINFLNSFDPYVWPSRKQNNFPNHSSKGMNS